MSMNPTMSFVRSTFRGSSLIRARVLIRVSFSSQVPDNPPNYILFLSNLPEETNEMMLSMLFNQ